MNFEKFQATTIWPLRPSTLLRLGDSASSPLLHIAPSAIRLGPRVPHAAIRWLSAVQVAHTRYSVIASLEVNQPNAA